MEEVQEQNQPMSDLSQLSCDELAQEIYKILDAKKAYDIKVLNVMGKTDTCDRMVLATGSSVTHLRFLGNELERQTAKRNYPPIHMEGRNGNTWIVLDFAEVMVHLFTREVREFYNLDKLYREDV